MRDERWALLWHLAESLLVLSLVGLIWSMRHQGARLVETKRPAR